MSLISVCKVAQNKDYRYKEGLSLVINIVQEIWEKNVMTNLDLESAQNSILSNDIHIYIVGQFIYCTSCVPHRHLTHHSFCMYDHHGWHETKRKVKLCCKYSLSPCPRFFLSKNSSRGNLP